VEVYSSQYLKRVSFR